MRPPTMRLLFHEPQKTPAVNKRYVPENGGMQTGCYPNGSGNNRETAYG